MTEGETRLRSRSIVLAAAAVAVLALLGWLARRESGSGETAGTGRSRDQTYALPPGVSLVTPPVGWPSPGRISDEAQAIERVRAMMETDAVWEDTFVRSAKWGDVDRLISGGLMMPYATPAGTQESDAYNEPVWIVGFRGQEAFSVGELRRAGQDGRPDQTDAMTTEAFVVVSDVGGFIQYGTLNTEFSGTVTPADLGWNLEDITGLPVAP